eukprot:1822933-Amphidinium_carterae.1
MKLRQQPCCEVDVLKVLAYLGKRCLTTPAGSGGQHAHFHLSLFTHRLWRLVRQELLPSN